MCLSLRLVSTTLILELARLEIGVDYNNLMLTPILSPRSIFGSDVHQSKIPVPEKASVLRFDHDATYFLAFEYILDISNLTRRGEAFGGRRVSSSFMIGESLTLVTFVEFKEGESELLMITVFMTRGQHIWSISTLKQI